MCTIVAKILLLLHLRRVYIPLHEEESARQWVTAYNFPAAKQGLVKKYRFKHFNPIPTQSFVFNTRRQPFQDIYFRQALTYAYDFRVAKQSDVLWAISTPTMLFF